MGGAQPEIGLIRRLKSLYVYLTWLCMMEKEWLLMTYVLPKAAISYTTYSFEDIYLAI